MIFQNIFHDFFDYFLTKIANLLISPFSTYFDIKQNFFCHTGVIVGVILLEKSFQRRVLHLCRFEHVKYLYINSFALV